MTIWNKFIFLDFLQVKSEQGSQRPWLFQPKSDGLSNRGSFMAQSLLLINWLAPIIVRNRKINHN